MPRPKKDAHEKRDTMIRVRFTASEQKRLLASSALSGCNASDYIRLKVLDNVPRLKKASNERAQLITGLGELGKVGSNLNQIARALNRRALTGRGEWVPDQLIENALQGVDTLTRHLITLLEHGGH